jgi:hypothetical protein
VATTTRLLGVEVAAATWMPRAVARQGAGTPRDWIRVPTGTAQRLLAATTRLVADLPADSDADVVWHSGTNELLVHTDRVGLTCNVGLLGVGVPVECDQSGPVTLTVPFAVGTDKDTRGLLMSTFDRVDGPDAVVGSWSEAVTAFAWESVLTLAQRLCAAAGKDASGRPLVPVAVGALRGSFLVRPMARHG